MVVPQVDIFAYTDWQGFLRDWFESRRLQDSAVSLQQVSLRLGFRSKSHLHRLLTVKGKTLALHQVEPLGTVLGLGPQEMEYWRALVEFSRAHSLDERNRAYQRMHGLQGARKAKALEGEGFEYFGTWYLPVLREALVLGDWGGDYGRLARLMEPPITEAQAKRGVALLLRLGVVRETARGGFEDVSAVVRTPPEVASLAVTNFQKDMLGLASRALEQLRGTEREITTVTFTIPDAKFGRIRELMRKFQEDVARESVAASGRHDRVFQLNLQCFPVTTKLTKEKKK